MNLGDLPLTKIFWSIFTVEAILVAAMLVFLLFSLQSGPSGGAVGAWLIVIPIAVLAIIAGIFLSTNARWVRITCISVLVWPAIYTVVGTPIGMIVRFIGGTVRSYGAERERRGEHLFKEAGQRKLAAAIADHDIERVKAALHGAGDLNRIVDKNLPYYVPLGDKETLLSFACDNSSDDSDASVEVVRLLLAAGANPNLPPAYPLNVALARSGRVLAILLEAGADPNADHGESRKPVWWSVLVRGKDPDGKKLQLLLAHGADITRRESDGAGVLDRALEEDQWLAVWHLAQRMPAGKDTVVGSEGKTVHDHLAAKVKAFKESGSPVPDDLATALAGFDAEKN
ncbi:hypothetical protein F183_A31350 [Bryobacterales bacterium F-183]|nr:hypothetical protein F183_A31350 [Bryobacterales bacterium F-183]